MAFPWLSEKLFETGDATEFDSETDGNGVLNIRHYKQLAQQPVNPTTNKPMPMPYRGAYMMEVNLAGADTNQYLQEDDDFDTSANATIHAKVVFYVTGDLTMADTNRFTLFTLQNTSNVDESVIDIRNNSGVIEVLAAETGSASTVRATGLELDKWHTAELKAHIDAGGGDDGTLDFYLDGTQVGAQITSLDQGAITHARVGVIGVDAGTTAGRVYIGEVMADDARLYPHPVRNANPRTITKSQHLFVGPGYLDWAALVSSGDSDDVILLFDTDTADTNQAQAFKIELDWDVHTSFSTPTYFQNGCYVQLAGTNCRGQAKWVTDMGDYRPNVFSPMESEIALRRYALGS